MTVRESGAQALRTRCYAVLLEEKWIELSVHRSLCARRLVFVEDRRRGLDTGLQLRVWSDQASGLRAIDRVAYGRTVRALLIANSDDCDAGFVGERFRHHGYSFVECHRERPGEWESLDGIELVLLLGSEWSVYWPHLADEVAAEFALIRQAQARNLPIYGICYGAQSIAHALGGSVQRGTEPEIGWYDNITSEIPDVIPAGPWLQWHYDVVTVPPGATELAHSPVAPQAFRMGRTFATQFHPEVNETMITRWSSGGGSAELHARGSSSEAVRAETSRNVLTSRPNAERLVDWYLDNVAGC